MPVRALLFDFDGTMVDTESVDLRAWHETFERHGVAVPLDLFSLRVGTIGAVDELDVLDALVGEPVDREAVTAARRARELELLAAEGLRAGVVEYLDTARDRGLAVGIVTSSSRWWIDHNLERLALEHEWACVVCADGDGTRCKPSPVLYEEALSLVGAGPHEAVALEDSPHGVAAATAAGIFTVAVPNPVTRSLDLSAADLVVESLADLPLADLLDRVPGRPDAL